LRLCGTTVASRKPRGGAPLRVVTPCVRATTLRANGRNPAGSRNCNSRCGFPGFAPTTPSLPELPHSYWVFVQRLLFISLLCVDYMRSGIGGQVRSGGVMRKEVGAETQRLGYGADRFL